MTKTKSTYLALLAVLLSPMAANADSISAIDPVGEAAFGSGNFTVGWSFTANEDILVTDLGYYDRGADGLADDHLVGVWTIGGMLLGSATVTNANVLDGLFRYASISSLLLSAGMDYVIGALNSNSADGYIASVSFSTPDEISFIQGRFAGGGSLAFPGSVDNTGGASIFGASFKFTEVPEPGTLALLGLGLAGMSITRRRKKV